MITNIEVWKLVPSHPELEASSFGRIRVIPYKVPVPNGGFRMCGGFSTKGQWDGKRFIYNRGGKNKTLKVARLVCEAFNGPAPEGTNVCMHKDEDARNNTPDNLVWGTQKLNLNFPKFLKYCSSRTGENNPFMKGRRGVGGDW
jgi:HNH endonuclease